MNKQQIYDRLFELNQLMQDDELTPEKHKEYYKEAEELKQKLQIQ
ncbi:hypothetical protein BH09BAC1_BH09BAC1_14370 [soil metagenome]